MLQASQASALLDDRANALEVASEAKVASEESRPVAIINNNTTTHTKTRSFLFFFWGGSGSL